MQLMDRADRSVRSKGWPGGDDVAMCRNAAEEAATNCGVADRRRLRLKRPGGFQGRRRLHESVRVVALPDRQCRQSAQWADLESALAIDAQQAQAFFQFATSPRQLPEPEPAGADVAARNRLVATVTGH